MIASTDRIVPDRFAQAYMRRVAWRLIGQRVFQSQDFDDVTQDLTVALLEGQRSFDPAKSRWTYFVKTIVDRKAVSLVRTQFAKSRGHGFVVTSLNMITADADGSPSELAQQICESQSAKRLGLEYRNPLEQVELSLTLRDLLASLPTDLAGICGLLAEKSVAQAARELGIPRTTLIGKLESLRDRFADAALGPRA